MTSPLRSAIFALSALLLCAAPLTASAQKAKSKAAPTLPEGDMGKKKTDAPTEPAGPTSLRDFEQSQFDERVKALQARKSEVRTKQIRDIEDILARNPYHQRKGELYHRLAEKHWEESKYQFLLAMDEYRKQMDAYDAGTLSSEPSLPSEDHSVALDYYRRIQREFPTYHRIDEVTFYLAKGLLLEGENKKNPNLKKEGVSNLKKIVQEYPKSRFVPEAYLALGEYYFDKNSLFYAKNNYEAIINNHKKASMFNYALYKLAWVYYNLREFEKSVGTFKDVVEKIGESNKARIIEFREQALNDLVRVYAEMDDGWKSARSYFLDKVGEEATYDKLRKLGELLMGMDKDEEAIALYSHFLDKFPQSATAVEWWENILGIRVEQNSLPRIEKDTRRMVGFFNDKGSWHEAHATDKELLGKAHDASEARTLWIATRYHQEAQRLNNAQFFDKSIDLYRLFLTNFSDSEHAYRVNFYLAEILYDQKADYREAVTQYNKVLERDQEGEFTEDAALGAVYCYDELIVAAGLRERASGKRRAQKVKLSEKELRDREALIEETELHELEKGFVDSVDSYVRLVTAWLKNNPDLKKEQPERGEKIPEMSYIAAQMLYNHGKYRESVKRLQVIFDYDPNHEFAAYAVNLLIDAYARLGHWEKVEAWAQKLIDAKNFKVKNKRELNRIRAIAINEQATESAMRKEYSQAVAQNMRIVKEFRKSDPELAATSLYNVAAIYEKARDIPKAIKTYRSVRKKFPKAKIAPEAQYTIGVIYESQTQFAKAAEAFAGMEGFRKDDETKAADAMLNSGLIWEALDSPKKAIKMYEKFVRLFPGREETPSVALRIGVLQQEQGDRRSLDRAKRYFLKFARKYKSSVPLVVEAFTRAGNISRELDKRRFRRDAQRHYGLALEQFAALLESGADQGRAKYYAANAAFAKGEYIYEDFTKVVLDAKTMKNIKLLKKTLVDKGTLLKEAEVAFQGVLDYKEPQWNAAALFRNGLLYYEFRDMLLEAPLPEDLPYEIEDQYRATLEDTAKPIEEKALTAFGIALDLAHKQKVYNDWSRKSAEFASKINPDEFPVDGEKEATWEHTRDTLTSASFQRFVKRGDIVVDMSK